MADKARLFFRLCALYARMDFLWVVQDWRNGLVILLSDLVLALSRVSGVFLLASRFGGIGWLSADETLWMLSFFMASDGALLLLFGGNNVHQISRRIARGQLDHMLIQPLPLWMQWMTEGFLPVSGGGAFFCGVILLCVVTARIGLLITPQWVAALFLLAACHVGIEMGFSFLLATAAFYRPVACEEISSAGYDLLSTLGRYPLSGHSQALTVVLTTALPAGLMAWLPSLILLGKIPRNPALFFPLSVALIFLAAGMAGCKKGMKHYAKTSCVRYRDLGHRS